MGAHYKNTTQLLGTEQTFDIKGVYVHPEYNSVTRYNYDIALMHLERPAILGQGRQTLSPPSVKYGLIDISVNIS